MGWAGIRNGDLLRRAQSEFDVLITVDKNLSQQQNLELFSIAVIVLRARSNRLADLRLVIPELRKVLASVAKGAATVIKQGTD